MLDFVKIDHRNTRSGFEVYPRFICMSNRKDIMIRGGDFYAIWDEDNKLWSTDEGDVVRLIDNEIDKYISDNKSFLGDNVVRKYMWDSDSGSIDRFHKYCQQQMRDMFVPLDNTLSFANSPKEKNAYSSKYLDYALAPGPIDAWDKLISRLYSEEERHKIEWAIGSIITGDSKKLQKFLVLYGAAGTGKSTILNIIEKLFKGYYTVFDAKALGSANQQFALESFRTNPLVAIQHDGDLSRIEDNTRLNSLVSHELMTVNVKHKSSYPCKFNCFLFMGTNKPVKITDGKSGLIRRLIDVTPTGDTLSPTEYKRCMNQIDFELGAIAYHCQQVYMKDPGYYNDYIPRSMMRASNDFYNYVLDSYDLYSEEDGVSLTVAWERYNNYNEKAKVLYPLSKRPFQEELKNYFDEFKDRYTKDDGSRVRSYYVGFKKSIFDEDMPKKEIINSDDTPEWLKLSEQLSVFDDICRDCPAQYASDKETPISKWENVTTKLCDIDTRKLHYVKIPEEYVVIDFDLKDENGNKSFKLNVEAASAFPPTYTEVSKSGEGIHLTYKYKGDPTELDRIYNNNSDIEVKVFTGNSSLRRKVILCNNYAFTELNVGALPLRKVKKNMIDKNIIVTEKTLRKTIERCLNKEIHSSTKSNIDFINKVLEDAYNDKSVIYDLSDMYSDVMWFAAHSTNQSKYCTDLVMNMHFKSEEPAVSVPEVNNYDDKPIAVFDIEVFPNLLLINWKILGEGAPMNRMINPTPEEVEWLVNNFLLIGFNCRKYDNHILHGRIMGYDNNMIYQLSKSIVSGDNSYMFGVAYNYSYTDIYDFASAGNKKSLKKLEIEMGIHHAELNLDWDQPVPEEKWELVSNYCDNDVIATEAAFNYLSADWTARQILAAISGGTVNDTTNTLTTKLIFGNNRHPQSEGKWRDLSKPCDKDYVDEEMYDFLSETFPKMMSMTHGEKGSILPYFPSYEYKFGVSTYLGEKVGEGGRVYAKVGFHGNVALLDITSQHPHSAMAECVFGPRYTRVFRSLVMARVDIKHEDWDSLRHVLDGKLMPYVDKVINGELTSKELSNALKTAINSVYGLTAARFDNPFKHPDNKDNIVAKRGALFMMTLEKEVERLGYTVAHIKTDSIKIPDADMKIIDFVKEFGAMYGYNFEHEATYDKMCLVNDAVYIAKYKSAEECERMYGYIPDENNKHPNEWTATGKQFAVPYLFKTLFSKEPITFEDMCETFNVQKGAIYMDNNSMLPDVSVEEKELEKLNTKYKKGIISDSEFEAESNRLCDVIDTGHDMQFVGRVGQFTPVKEGGCVLYRVNEGKHYALPGSKGYRWVESESIRNSNNISSIDTSYYNELVNDAVNDISKYIDFEWFVSDEPYFNTDFVNVPNVDEDEIPFV